MRGGSGASRTGTASTRSLDVQWETPRLNLYDHIDSEDFLSALPADFKTAGKPLLVYVSSDAPENDKRTAEVEQGVLRDETVALGARLFRSVRLKGDKLDKGHAHWATLGGRELPRVILVDTAGKKVSSVEGKELSASNLYKQMRKAAAKTYKTDLDKVVKESRALLDEMDRIEAKQTQLAEQKKDAKPGQEKALSEQEAQLAQQLKDVQSREAELLNKVGEERKVTKA